MIAHGGLADAASAAAEQVSRQTGLAFGGSHGPRMIEAIARGMLEAGTTSPSRYAEALERDQRTYEALVDRLTVAETYFFREPKHFELLRSVVREVDQRRPGGGLRVWSAGCASGEEPYSVAIVLGEEDVLDRASILGTDLSPRALDRARHATYGRWSLRRCGSPQRAAYFAADGPRFRLHPRFVESVEFRAGSLAAGPPARAAFDFVLCRNVLIYLADEAVAAAASSLRDALAPGGWLVVGASDPLLDADGLDLVRTEHGIAYRRAAPRAGCRVARRAQAPAPRAQTRTTPTEMATPRPPPPAARPRGADLVEQQPETPDVDAIRALGASGDVAGTERLLVRALEHHPLDAELRYLAAALYLGTGRPAEAAASSSAAIYLDPGLAVAHLLLGRAEQSRANPTAARRSFLHALEILAAMPADAEVPLAEGERAGRLAATAARLAGG